MATNHNNTEPSADLSHRILLRIRQEERRRVRRNAAGFGVLLAGSAGFLVFGIFNLAGALSQSGFLEFASLLFSDFGTMVANLPDFLFSIAESFPVFSTAILFSGVFFSMWSARQFFGELSLMRHQTSL